MIKTLSPALNRRLALAGLLALPLSACKTMDIGALESILGSGILSQAEAARGIRAALDNGILSALGIVGRKGGFLNDGKIHIPLPKVLSDVQSVLSKIGAGGVLNELETQLNRGAEKAAPVAKDIFFDAVAGLSISDAIGIVRGPQNAATNYLQEKTTPRLTSLFSPIMENALGQTGALRLLDQVTGDLRNIPFAPTLGANARTDLIGHGVKYGLDGVFHYVAKEEAAIRRDPAKRTSEILRRVFGSV
ncbi:MAG: hypothetical protein COC03_03475 [Robiginitomaculum sp.]|nr:MAG: hypothetical protein COC03_03475 [Robiginitomaculum sp.]PHQ68215.1 MAG: hypothetical protein COB92_01150 [Robiginitomaculum sp.]